MWPRSEKQIFIVDSRQPLVSRNSFHKDWKWSGRRVGLRAALLLKNVTEVSWFHTDFQRWLEEARWSSDAPSYFGDINQSRELWRRGSDCFSKAWSLLMPVLGSRDCISSSWSFERPLQPVLEEKSLIPRWFSFFFPPPTMVSNGHHKLAIKV